MEHFRSTLAVTAIAVLGLITADRILHPGTVEDRPRGARVVAVTADVAPAPTIWTDPPVKLHGAEPAAIMADSAAILSPRLTVALPEGARTAGRLPGALVASPAVEQKTKSDPLGDLIRKLDGENAG